MRLSVAFELTEHALTQDRARTALTILAVAIGVAAVMTIAALGNGARRQIEAQIQGAGTNLVIVTAGNPAAGIVRQGLGAAGTLTAADAEAIAADLRAVELVSPVLSGHVQVVFGDSNWATHVQGAASSWPVMRAWPVAAGAFFTDDDVRRARKVAVLGSVVRDQLFGAGVNPVDAEIRVNAQPFTVVGVMAAKGQTGMGQDQDDAILVPYTTAQKKLLGITYIHGVLISTASPGDTASVADATRTLLRARHRLPPGAPDDFMVRSVDDIAEVYRQTTRTLTILLSAVAAVSLLVGGIGVMNIMLVSVTERTQEIGLRMAVGARTRDVLGQFLVEAVMLTAAGGAAGVLLGFAAARLTTAIAGWPTSVSIGAVVLGLLVAGSTGIGFGLYPANKAASLDPVQAMHAE